MTFSISALVSAQDSHMKADSEAGVLIPGTIWKISCHNLFITYFTLTFSRIDFYIAEKIIAQILKRVAFVGVWFQKDIKQCRSVQ